MPDPSSIIKFHSGQSGAHRFFFIGADGCSKKAARVYMSTMIKINKALDHRREIELPITNMAEFLATFLPLDFLNLLNQAGISMVEAWHHMSGLAFPTTTSVPPHSKRQVSKTLKEAEKLARILASVEGGKKSPKYLITTLIGLIKSHLPQALEILQDWAETRGHSKKGGYILVGTANRNTKKASAKVA